MAERKQKPAKGRRQPKGRTAGRESAAPLTARREEVLRAALENTPHGIVVYGKSLELLAWNEVWADMLGFSKAFLARAGTMEDVIREEFRRGFDADRFPDVEAKVQSWLRKARSARKPYSFEQSLPDGRRVEVRSRPVTGLGLVRTIEDISERKRRERALVESEMRLQLATTAMGACVWEVNLETGERYWSPEIAAIMGYGPRWRPPDGDGWYRHVHPDDRARVRDEIEAHLSGGSPHYKAEFKLRHKKGHYVWVQSVGRITENARHGRRMTGFVVDITEAREAQEDLQDSRERYALAVAGADQGLWDWDPVSMTLYVSPRFRDMMGFPLDVERITPDEWHSRMHPDDVQGHLDAVGRYLSGKEETFFSEYRVLRRDGTFRWIQANGLGERDAKGWVHRIAGSVTDIHDRKVAEEALRRSEERYALAFEGANEGLWDWEDATGIFHLSDAARAMMNFPADLHPVEGRHFLEAIHPDDRESYQTAVRNHLKGATDTLHSEFRVPDGDGGWRWLMAHGKGLRAENGMLIRMTGSISDLTARKLAEQELAHQKNILEATLDNASDGIIMMDADTRMVAWNRRYEEMFDVRPGELEVGRRHEDVVRDFLARGGVSGYTVENVLPELWDAVRAGRVSRAEIAWSDELFLERVCTPLKDGGAVMTYTDITERKRNEAAVSRSEEQFRTLVENVPGITFRTLFNDDWDILFVGGQVEEICGYPASDFMGDPPKRTWKEIVPPEDYPVVDAAVDPAVAGHRQYEMEYRIRHRDGSIRWLNDRGAGVYDEAGDIRWIDSVAFDVTAMKEAEDQLRFAKEAAERAFADLKQTQARLLHSQKMASLGQLTAGIAHEIKNPLNFINNFSETSVELLDELKETLGPALGALDEKAGAAAAEIFETLAEDLGTIGKHGHRADNIVRSMLLHSRGSSDDRRPVQLNDLVAEALDLAWHGEPARDKSFNLADVSIQRAFGGDVGEIEVVPQEITRVLLNLFANAFYALKMRVAAKGGGYRPVLSVVTAPAGGDLVELRIRDNGTGMPPDVKEKLFSPFFTTKPAGEGTGLGLTLCHDIVVQQHGGSISVDTEAGSHTEFEIRLPRRAAGNGET